MKRTSLERNAYEEEGDVGEGDDVECQEDEDNDVNEDDEDDDGEGHKDIMIWSQRSVRGREEVGSKLFEKKDVGQKSEDR
jgi:hypothetical protein